MGTKPKVYLRADGNAQIGLGHVIRSLALAEMLNEDFECHFIIRNPINTLRKQITEICQSIIELPETNDNELEASHLSKEFFIGDEIVVLDGYNFQTTYQQTIKAKCSKLVCIDDINDCHFIADIIINYSCGFTPQMYSAEAYTKFFLGLKYVLLREPFRKVAREYKQNNDESNAVFICFGGADPRNATLKVLKECEKVSSIKKCYLVLGGAFNSFSTIDHFIKTSSLEVVVLSNLSAQEMIYYMKKCGSAITSTSTVAYEYLSVGGKLFLNVIAENQKWMFNHFVTNGIAYPVEHLWNNVPVKDNQSIVSELFDGNQKDRYLRVFHDLL